MIRALPLGLGLAICLAAGAQEEGEIEPLGTWVRSTGEAQVEISRCGQDFCAVNDWVRDPQSDEKAGDILVMSLQRTAPGHFEGEAYDKRRDRRYAMSLTVTATAMRSEGCVLIGLICKSVEWTRP
jgi:uncharacterized protein (DUF2147 family)